MEPTVAEMEELVKKLEECCQKFSTAMEADTEAACPPYDQEIAQSSFAELKKTADLLEEVVKQLEMESERSQEQ